MTTARSGRLLLVSVLTIYSADAFLSPIRLEFPRTQLHAGGEGGDSEWAKALFESSGEAVRDFEQDMKMKGLLKGNVNTNPKLTANQNLIEWLIREGEVYLAEQSSWGEAPHPMASKSSFLLISILAHYYLCSTSCFVLFALSYAILSHTERSLDRNQG